MNHFTRSHFHFFPLLFISFSYFFFYLGCEDVIVESISLESLISILKWSSQPYGSKWVHRQAVHFLCEEFSQVMTSDVLYELTKDQLLTAIQSDYLQVWIWLPPLRWLPSIKCKHLNLTFFCWIVKSTETERPIIFLLCKAFVCQIKRCIYDKTSVSDWLAYIDANTRK